jgi:NAD(P)-dependent dehydrogenase (short-subunit alcohol dehydrogenase family)
MNSPQRESVLVTGASTGLGLETALHLAGHGYRVFATVRDPAGREPALQAARERGVTLDVIELDLADPESIESAVEAVLSESPRLFGLVNNAGIGLRGCFEDLDDDEVRQVFEVNVFGTMVLTRRILPSMRAAGRGRVITITSVGGRVATFGLSAYIATKFAQEGFGESLALEIAPFGLHSILIEPGIIPTSRWTVNRGLARGARDPDSPYAAMFRRHEVLADEVVSRSRNRPSQVAEAVHRALTARRPKLRYLVGRPARAVVFLRRFLPDSLFERLYFGALMRRVTDPKSEASRIPPVAEGSPRAEAPPAPAAPR